MTKPRIAKRIAVWAVRIATTAVITATAYVAATTFSSMSVNGRPSSVRRESLLLPSPVNMSQGTWMVAGVPFALSTSVVSDQNLEATLSRHADVRPVSRTASVLESKLLDRVKQLATNHEVQGDIQIFHVRTATIRARLIVAGDPDAPCVHLARVAYRRGPGEWTVVEADCLKERTAPATEEEGSFLPLPESAHTIGRRFDAEGRLQTHLVSVSDNIDDLAQTLGATRLGVASRDSAWTNDLPLPAQDTRCACHREA